MLSIKRIDSDYWDHHIAPNLVKRLVETWIELGLEQRIVDWNPDGE